MYHIIKKKKGETNLRDEIKRSANGESELEKGSLDFKPPKKTKTPPFVSD